MLLVTVALLTGCTSDDIVQEKDKEKGAETPKGITFTINEPKICAKARVALFADDEEGGADAKTRTIIKHTPGQGADVYWSNNDYIYVQDHSGTWQKSTAIQLNDGGASATFTLPNATYDDGCAVNYTITDDQILGRGISTTIKNVQTQSAGNDFSHAGISGDCAYGVARVTDNPNKYNFTLRHTPAYLCFLPRFEGKRAGVDFGIKKITVTNDGSNMLAAIYPISSAGGYGWEERYHTITLNPGTNGFILHTEARPDINACYMVIGTGTHKLTINYTIMIYASHLTMDFTQVIEENFEAGKIYDITMNFVPTNLKGYYMWDAKKEFWEGHIKVDGNGDDEYPKTNADPRWYHEPPGGVIGVPLAATESCKDCPNINELCWYIKKGDPHWVTQKRIIYRQGRIEEANVGGIWLKKKAAIIRDNSDIDEHRFSNAYPDQYGVDHDLRTYYVLYMPLPNAPITNGAPANTDDYFFLPALGNCEGKNPPFIGIDGLRFQGGYWTSSACPYDFGGGLFVYAFTFGIDLNYGYTQASIGAYPPTRGYRAVAFE